MKIRSYILCVVVSALSLVACGSGSTGGGGDGSSGSSGKRTKSDDEETEPTPRNRRSPTESSSGGKPSEQTCSAAAINGRCLDGPNKGASCCHSPMNEDDPPCPDSESCDTVCEHCE